MLREVTESAGQIILFIDELHTVVGAGAAEGAMDASNMLETRACPRASCTSIGATTLDEYRKHIEKDAGARATLSARSWSRSPSVEERFDPAGLKRSYEVHHGVRITEAAHHRRSHPLRRYISGPIPTPTKRSTSIDEGGEPAADGNRRQAAALDEADRKQNAVWRSSTPLAAVRGAERLGASGRERWRSCGAGRALRVR